jgi:type I restriction enzyme R subunit
VTHDARTRGIPSKAASRKRVDARARVRLAIEDILDEGLPCAYTPELYQGKCKAVFEHVYENYVGSGVSVYTEAA